MALIRKPDLSLVGLGISGDSSLYDDRIALPGNHLRWNFNAEMGFPDNGFTLSRAVWNPQFFTGDTSHLSHALGVFSPVFDWKVHLNLPESLSEAMNRVRQGFERVEHTARFGDAARELLEVVHQLRDSSNPAPMFLRFFESADTSGLNTRLRMMDMMILASLDPYLARMMGLYYIDETAVPSETYLYQITGHWGDTSFPLIPVDFGNIQIPQKLQTLQFGAVKIISAGRTIGVRLPENFDLIGQPQLGIVGDANPAFKILFDFPVEEVILDFDPVFSSVGSLSTLVLRADGSPVRANIEGDQILIRRPGSEFQRLDFPELPGDGWYFFRIHYRKKMNPIGDVSALHVLNPGATQPVKTPSVTGLTPEAMPPLLNENGEINNEASQVSLSAGLLKPSVETLDVPDGVDTKRLLLLFNQPAYPIRLLFGSSKGRATASPQKTLNLQDGIYTPSLYREYTAATTLPDLAGYWPMNGRMDNIKDGAEPVLIGKPRFVKEHLDRESKYTLRFFGSEALVLNTQNHLKMLGDQFTLEASIKIDPANASVSTLIGNNQRLGFWLGLIKSGDGTFRLRLIIHNTQFDSAIPVPANYWLRVSACYSGSQVWFYHSHPAFAVPEDPVDATLGTVNIPAGSVTLGAENGSTVSRLQFPFTGNMADVCIWHRVIHPSESNALLARWGDFFIQQQATGGMVFSDQTTYVCSTVRDPVLLEQTLPVKALGTSFSVFLFVNPHSSNARYTTLVGNKFNQRLWIGLNKTGAGYRVRVWLNNRRFEWAGLLEAGEWSHVGMMYDGASLRIFINGQPERSISAFLGALAKNDLPLGIGSDAGTTNVASQYRFNGFIQGLQIWRVAITADEWLRRMSAVQHIDKYLPNGRYYYAVKGIDLFGRTSDWSTSIGIRTLAQPQYQAPVNVHAAFLPLSGSITRVDDTPENYFVLDTSLEFNANVSRGISGYDVVLSRTIEADDPASTTGETRTLKAEQLLEIDAFENVAGLTRLTVKKVPFLQLFPTVGDGIIIKFDYKFQLKWAWTGIQQLYFPEITAFCLFELNGFLNEINGVVTGVVSRDETHHTVTLNGRINVIANELTGEKCLIGPHMYRVESHTTGRNAQFSLLYEGMPAVTPHVNDTLRITLREQHSSYMDYEDKRRWRNRRIGIPVGEVRPLINTSSQAVSINDLERVTPEALKSDPPVNDSVAQRQELLLAGVDWLPLSQVYQITFPDFTQPDGYTHPEAANYIPGALVFFDSYTGRNRWRSFYVLWHRWEAAHQLVLYVTPGEKDEALPVFQIDATHPVKFYPGRAFSYEGTLSRIPALSDTLPTMPYHLVLTAKDGRRRESTLSRRTTVVAVNRKRPPMGPKPEAVIQKKADYYDTCKVDVRWRTTGGASIRYKLYRANDGAIYTRDMEMRRTRQLFYRGMTPGEVFHDDPDFNDWLATRYPPIDVSTLFPEKESAQWKQVTPVWRAWADRFYPALTNDELNVIAQRAGNEKAFALITGQPLREPLFTDIINGVVRNRYYYRLRLLNAALSESTIWGELSDPLVPPVVMAPRRPVFTKVEAGDRRITLHWSLNREPDLKEYRLYRAETRAELEDLRWWQREPDPRVVAVIPDPRILTRARGLTLPGEWPIAPDGLLGVYTLGEFDSLVAPATPQPGALNYWNPVPTAPAELPSEFMGSPDGSAPHSSTNLRKIADGTAMAIVYLDTSGEMQTAVQAHSQIPFADEGLVGLRDHYYRLVAVNESGITSEPSEPILSRPFELKKPEPPVLSVARMADLPGEDISRVTISVSQLEVEILLQSKTIEEEFWHMALSWHSIDRDFLFEDHVEREKPMMYRAFVRSTAKRVSEASKDVVSLPTDSNFIGLLS